MNEDKTIILKQDINFLDKPLWFQNLRHDGLGHVWTDVEGYEYRTGYKLPDKIDALFLFYLLYKSQKLNYQKEIKVSKYEVLKECGLVGNCMFYYQRLEDSLDRWKNVTIKFHGTFYDAGNYKTISFGIINDYKIDEVTKRIEINFNENWILKIKESNFFKYINFEYYKALKRPLSRRLYELLCKAFKGRDEWSIHLTKLGAKLTIYSRTVTTKEGKTEVIYASDVLVAIKPTLNEINNLAKISDIVEKTGIAKEDLFTVKHHITGEKQDRIIHFHKTLVYQEKQVKINASEPPKQEATLRPSEQPPQPKPSLDATHQELLNRLLGFKISKSKALTILKQYSTEQIKLNLDYTESQLKLNKVDNPPAYIAKAIEEDYYATSKEKAKTDQEIEREKEKIERQKAEAEAEKERREKAEKEQNVRDIQEELRKKMMPEYEKLPIEAKKQITENYLKGNPNFKRFAKLDNNGLFIKSPPFFENFVADFF